MKIRGSLFYCFLVLVILFVSNSAAQNALNFKQGLPDIMNPGSPPNYSFRGKNYQGFIATCSDKDISSGICWNPTKDDIARLEQGLPKYVLSNILIKDLSVLLPKYVRFYSGNYKKYKKVITVWLDYSSRELTKKILATPEIQNAYFFIRFRYQTGRFFDFKEEGNSDAPLLFKKT